VKELATAKSSRKQALIASALVFVVALAVYAWTLAPTVTLVDSGELITAATFLGNAHPPGFPFYLLLSHIATLVPLGNIAARVNFASAIFSAAASALLVLIMGELVSGTSVAINRKAQRGKIESPWTVSLPALGAGFLLAFSRTLWSYATIAEVYTLNTLLILLIFYLMLGWRRRIIEDERYGKRSAVLDFDRLLYAAAVVFGLALGVHHVTVALMLPALAVLVYSTQGVGFFTSSRLLFAAIFSFGALVLVYCYLPLAAWHQPVLNWGDPRSLDAIWQHITGKQYQAYFSFAPGIVGRQFADFGKLLLREFGLSWLPLVLLVVSCGYIYAFKRNRSAFWFVTAILFANVAFALFYDIAEDKDAYYLPSFVSVTILAGLGLSWLQQRFRNRIGVGAIGALLLPAIALAGNWAFNNRRHYFIAHDYVDNIQETIAPGGLLLTLDWQVASPMFYTREVEDRRRDIELVDINLLRRPWYLDYLSRSFPRMTAGSKLEFDNFRARLNEWNANPAVAGSPFWQRQMHEAYLGLLRSLITTKMAHGSVYLTQDVLFFTQGEEKALTEWINDQYQAIPRGLVFELSSDRNFQDPGEVQLQIRGLNDGTISFESDDVVSLKIVPVYKAMLLNRGRYLALFHRTERAVEAFTKALAVDPNFEMARRELGENLNKLRSSESSEH